MSKVVIGKTIPAFNFSATPGKYKKFSDLKEQNVVLYFYPKDDTSGCTMEAENFRDHYQDFKHANTEIIGISRDSLKSHDKFIEKFALPFALISDEDESICNLFDVMKEKSMYGKKYFGIDRSTFLITKNKLVKEWRGVKVPGHVKKCWNP